MPSMAMLTTPERSQKIPARAPRMSGVAFGTATASMATIALSGISTIGHLDRPRRRAGIVGQVADLAKAKHPLHDRWGCHEHQDERLNYSNDVGGNLGEKLHSGRPRMERTKQDRRGNQSKRIGLSQ